MIARTLEPSKSQDGRKLTDAFPAHPNVFFSNQVLPEGALPEKSAFSGRLKTAQRFIAGNRCP